METVTIGVIQMTWDPETRLAVIRFERDMRATGPDAEVLVAALEAWTGEEGEPFGLLGDGGRLSGMDGDFRVVWSSFLRRHRDDCYVSFFNQNFVVRISADMFRLGTGLRLKSFAHEAQARAWLREMGIPA
jgi:hypothetical protein